MQFKYVIMEADRFAHGETNGEEHEVAFLFPGIIVHADFARFRRHTNLRGSAIVASGFVDIGRDGKPYCYGRSESLNIGSRGEIDSAIIARSSKHFSSSIKEVKHDSV